MNTVLADAVLRNIPLLSDRATIIFGADVTHAQPGEDSSASIAAVCHLTMVYIYIFFYCLFSLFHHMHCISGGCFHGLARSDEVQRTCICPRT